MLFRDILQDQFDFNASNYDQDSYPIRKGLPRLEAELTEARAASPCGSLHFLLCLLAYAHLGFPTYFDKQKVLNLGVDLVIHFIRGKWVAARPDLAPTIDKRPDNPHLEWFDAYSQGLLMTLLSERDTELKELADWPEAWMETDPSIRRRDPLYAKLYLQVVSPFRTAPFQNMDELHHQIAKTRKKELKHLHGAWQAALAGDQGAFSKGILESVQQWERSSHDGRCAHPKNCIAEDASVILAAGRRLGLEMPEVEPAIAARLLTRESIGLE